ncbi:hydrogenase expression/formation protein HypE [Desulfofundulus thermosubterraneus]|uniref:Hydrogenase maturation protein, carbamoyl dehydratase HypE n=1 Tax=Desulfofundulus thermosubterraneus DSM 16057 TaxID=1121432 RepID=A0A1M6FB43_9FIRM|nr:hydrogenase expression/formation protein HypE [Desulfofundulus thermosubterraneus]SHI94893.1 Hydrogenase maturation protein, carbamoyl dehydratase HypE [Desulfofundulus thermosubterraneus DSM 16057]
MENKLILLAHGDGGRLTHELVTGLFLKHFGNDILARLTDAAALQLDGGRIAITTDAFVINPPFFPGGDIGKLAVCGTVNDLAVSGAEPRYFTASFLIEEGFPLADLERVVASMARTCREAGVEIIAGDTKVVGRGQLDRIFINTTGLGCLPPDRDLGYHRITPGDLVLVNGNLGDHGMAVLARREGFGFEDQIVSDCAALNGIIGELLRALRGIKIMRDLTRGGMATAAKEIAAAAGVDIWLEEQAIPVGAATRGAAEMLGLDPLYLANEGKFMTVITPEEAEDAVALMRAHPLGRDACIIGEVRAGRGNVYLKTALGGTKFLDMLAGAPLPRIC